MSILFSKKFEKVLKALSLNGFGEFGPCAHAHIHYIYKKGISKNLSLFVHLVNYATFSILCNLHKFSFPFYTIIIAFATRFCQLPILNVAQGNRSVFVQVVQHVKKPVKSLCNFFIRQIARNSGLIFSSFAEAASCPIRGPVGPGPS